MRSHVNLLVLLAFLSSCKKENLGIDPVLNRSVDKNLVQMRITHPNSTKTQWQVSWKYDNRGRCTEISERRALPAINNIDSTITSGTYTFHYRDAERNPYWVSFRQVPDQSTYDTYFFYSPDGRKIKDSTIYQEAFLGTILKTGNYRYDQNAVYYSFQQTPINWTGSPNNLHPSFEDTVLVVQNNVKKYSATKFEHSLTSWTKRLSVLEYTYDDKINPFKQQNISGSLYHTGPEFNHSKWFDVFPLLGLNVNNIVTAEAKQTFQRKQSFSYIYDRDNYPVEASFTTSSSAAVSKVHFSYN